MVTGLAVGIALIEVFAITFPSAGPITPAQVWLATYPTQCLTNPWEQDWLQSHNNDYAGYPHKIPPLVTPIVTDYFARQGVVISDVRFVGFESLPDEHLLVCMACSCSDGYIMLVSVSQKDQDRMLGMGFSLPAQESLKGEGLSKIGKSASG